MDGKIDDEAESVNFTAWEVREAVDDGEECWGLLDAIHLGVDLLERERFEERDFGRRVEEGIEVLIGKVESEMACPKEVFEHTVLDFGPFQFGLKVLGPLEDAMHPRLVVAHILRAKRQAEHFCHCE